MRNILLAAILIAASTTFISVDAQFHPSSAGYCPNQPGGKCPKQKKISKSRKDFTPEQRKKIMEDARKVCIEKYGASSSVYRFDYSKWTVICNTPGM